MDKLKIQNRLAKDKAMKLVVCLLAALTAVPLFAILAEVFLRGYDQLSWTFFTEPTPTAYRVMKAIENGEPIPGGIANGIIGTMIMLAMAVMNDFAFEKGFIALLLTFVIAPCSDVFAFFVGSALKGPKLCPKLSPKKTWSGAIGGTLGGMLGAFLVWLVFRQNFGLANAWLIYLVVGLVGSVCTIIGDLIESLIKRKAGIKDMGKIMPGHGGIADRIDGISLASVFVMIIFLFV